MGIASFANVTLFGVGA
jgi:hypothetical protein